jgi:DNA-binding NarL/FixJ family response regulator
MNGQPGSRRVLIADADPNVRQALWLVCEEGLGLTVVAETADATRLPALIQASHPDLLLLEWPPPGANTSHLLDQLRSVTSIPLIAVGSDPYMIGEALQAGAARFICKADSPEKLIHTIRSVVEESNHRLPAPSQPDHSQEENFT